MKGLDRGWEARRPDSLVGGHNENRRGPEILKTRCVMTVIGGEVVFETVMRDTWDEAPHHAQPFGLESFYFFLVASHLPVI